MPKKKRIPLPLLGTSCSSGLLVDFIYDSSTHLPTHAAVKGGERRGLCGERPASVSTCTVPDGGLCRRCETQVTKVKGIWYVRDVAPALNVTPYDLHHEVYYD